MTDPQAVVIGFSGPDGSGKSTTATFVRGRLADAGYRVEVPYLYGCMFCIRSTRSTSGPAQPGSKGWIHRWHAVFDALTLSIRLKRAAGRVASTGSRGFIVTDRSPLDGLVKHRPGRGTLSDRIYRRAAGRYRSIFLLDADPETLARRDEEHSSGSLAVSRDRFLTTAASLEGVVVLGTTDRTAESLAEEIAGKFV